MNTVMFEMHVTILILNNAGLQWENNKASTIITLNRKIKKKNYVNVFKEAKIAYKTKKDITHYNVFSSLGTKNQNRYNKTYDTKDSTYLRT